MKRLVALLLAVGLTVAQAQTSTPPVSVASAALSIIRIALNLGSGRQEYIQVDVQADAPTVEQARHLAFRTAVEQAVGTVVASQSQSQHQRLVRNEIITYSSGFVDKFEILGQDVTAHGVRLYVRVWVAESRLAHRLLGRSVDNQNVPGDQLGAQISSLIHERRAGDRLVGIIMQDFPARSFVVKSDASRVQFDQYRRAILEVPVELRWDQNWVNSLFEALRRTQDPAKNWLVYNTVDQVNPVLKLALIDAHGAELFRQCYNWVISRSQVTYHYPRRLMLDIQRDQLIIDKNYYLQGTLAINLGQNTQTIERISQIKVSVIRANECN